MIDNASSLRTLLMDLEESCSVCQDRMKNGENIRKLNTCQHEFHATCIDNWLLRRSVLCPVCRHDIREANIRIPAARPRTGAHAQAIPPLIPRENGESAEPAPRLRQRD
jgi:hypothetical protein